MHRILLLGAGKIGRMIAPWLSSTGDFDVTVADASEEALARVPSPDQGPAPRKLQLDVNDRPALEQALKECDSVMSALSYHFSERVADAALATGVSYFDLTEDVASTRAIRSIAEKARPGQIFMPQCGLAPGFVSVAAQGLTRGFDRLDRVFMRVGALPQFPSNVLKYNLTWSTDGLVNEYCNPCEAIVDGQRREVLPLEGLEHFSIDGVRYEAFNTSGGLGTLCETLDGKVRDLNYKTIRYQGHRDYAAFLVNELRLCEQRELFRNLLEGAIPITFQDVVVVFCTVSGQRNGQLVQVSDARKVYNSRLLGHNWSAIQITTAAGIGTMVDLHRSGKLPTQGFVCQEQVSLDEFLANRFGAKFALASDRSQVPSFSGSLS